MTEEPDVTSPRRHTRAGDYDLIRKLGAGGFGVVFEARHRATGLPFAVKRIDLSVDDAERYRNEAMYPARIASRSLHVLGVHSFFHDPEDDVFYLVTELIAHGDLRAFLERSTEPLPVAQALDLGIGIAKGLAAIHAQGVIHRDLKPANVLMDLKDERWVPKIADFGLARSSRSVSIGEFASTGYAAPEQLDLMSEQALGPESDLFSFGMILYELLTGRKPTTAQDLREYGRWIGGRRPPAAPSTVRSELATWPQLDALCGTLLEFDRSRRLRSATEVVRLLADQLRQVERAAQPAPARHDSRPVVALEAEPPPPRRPSSPVAVPSPPRPEPPPAPTVVSPSPARASAVLVSSDPAPAPEVHRNVWTRRAHVAVHGRGVPDHRRIDDAGPPVERPRKRLPSDRRTAVPGCPRQPDVGVLDHAARALFGLAVGLATRLTGAQAVVVSLLASVTYQLAVGSSFVSLMGPTFLYWVNIGLASLLSGSAVFVFLAPWRRTTGRTIAVTLVALVVAVGVGYGTILTLALDGGAPVSGTIGALGMLAAIARWHRPSRRIVALTASWGLLGGVLFTAAQLLSASIGRRAAYAASYGVWQVLVGLCLVDRALFKDTKALRDWPWRSVLGVGLAAAVISGAGSWIRTRPKPIPAGTSVENPKNKLAYVWIPAGRVRHGLLG